MEKNQLLQQSLNAGFMAVGVPPGASDVMAKALDLGTQFAFGGLKSKEQKEAEYYLGRSTNEIEAAMDLNRFAFWTGLLHIDELVANYEYLWQALENVAGEISALSAAQGQRAIGDRDYGGKFEQVWRWQMRDQILEVYRSQPDHFENGYVIPAWWWDWPERSKFTETSPTPFLGDLPFDIPATPAGPSIPPAKRIPAGGTGKAAGTTLAGSATFAGVPLSAILAVGAIFLLKGR